MACLDWAVGVFGAARDGARLVAAGEENRKGNMGKSHLRIKSMKQVFGLERLWEINKGILTDKQTKIT